MFQTNTLIEGKLLQVRTDLEYGVVGPTQIGAEIWRVSTEGGRGVDYPTPHFRRLHYSLTSCCTQLQVFRFNLPPPVHHTHPTPHTTHHFLYSNVPTTIIPITHVLSYQYMCTCFFKDQLVHDLIPINNDFVLKRTKEEVA